MNTYRRGKVIEILFAAEDADSDPVAPDGVIGYVRDAAGQVVEYNATPLADDTYAAPFDRNVFQILIDTADLAVGQYQYGIVSTGTGQTAEVGEFYISSNPFIP